MPPTASQGFATRPNNAYTEAYTNAYMSTLAMHQSFAPAAMSSAMAQYQLQMSAMDGGMGGGMQATGGKIGAGPFIKSEFGGPAAAWAAATNCGMEGGVPGGLGAAMQRMSGGGNVGAFCGMGGGFGGLDSLGGYGDYGTYGAAGKATARGPGRARAPLYGMGGTAGNVAQHPVKGRGAGAWPNRFVFWKPS